MATRTSDACANCGAPLTGAFCANCGQKPPRPDPTLAEFVRDTTHELADWDGKVPSTLRALFFSPGLLTEDFLAGRRARWLTPLRVYLICSVVFFASRPIIEAITGQSPRGVAAITVDGRSGQLTPEDLEKIRTGLPARIFGADFVERAVRTDPERLNREIYAMLANAMFVLLPAFALFTNVAWRRTRPRYPAHLYAALHIHAAFFGAVTVARAAAIVPSRAFASLVAVGLTAYVVWYGLTALHRVFGQSWPRTILKALAIAIVYIICLNVVTLVLLGIVLSNL